MKERQKTEFSYSSLNQTMQLLDCSKFYLYKLIKKKVIYPYYLETDDIGNPTGKTIF